MGKYKKSFQESKSSFALCSTSSHNIKCLWSHKSNGSMVRSWSRRVTLLSRKLKLAGMKIPIMENWGNILLPFSSQHVTWDARLDCEGRWGEVRLTNFVQFIILDIQLMLQREVMAVKWDQLLGRPAWYNVYTDFLKWYFIFRLRGFIIF